MKKYQTGQRVPYGVYASAWPPDLRVVSADDEPLDGKPDKRYVRLPLLLVIAAGPALGGVFVLAFPLIVLGAVITALGQYAYRRVRELRDSQAHLVRLRWEPATSYLKHTDEDEDDNEPGEPNTDLADIEDEVRARRDRERT